MDEKKLPETGKSEGTEAEPTKLSRKTLTFYIFSLFSVAIVLILVSYIYQARADKQLDSLSSQLSEQQTVAQGATQRMEDLQRQVDQQQKKLELQQKTLEGVRGALGISDTDEITAAADQAAQSANAGTLLAQAWQALYNGDSETAVALRDQLYATYGDLTSSTDPVFPATLITSYEQICDQLG